MLYASRNGNLAARASISIRIKVENAAFREHGALAKSESGMLKPRTILH